MGVLTVRHPRSEYPDMSWLVAPVPPAVHDPVEGVAAMAQIQMPPPVRRQTPLALPTQEWYEDGWVTLIADPPPAFDAALVPPAVGLPPQAVPRAGVLRLLTQEWEQDAWITTVATPPVFAVALTVGSRTQTQQEYRLRARPGLEVTRHVMPSPLDGWQFTGAVEPLLRTWWPASQAQTQSFRTPARARPLAVRLHEWFAEDGWRFVEPGRLLAQQWSAIETQTRQAFRLRQRPLLDVRVSPALPEDGWIFTGIPAAPFDPAMGAAIVSSVLTEIRGRGRGDVRYQAGAVATFLGLFAGTPITVTDDGTVAVFVTEQGTVALPTPDTGTTRIR